MIKGEKNGVDFEIAETPHELWWSKKKGELEEEVTRLECILEFTKEMLVVVKSKLK